MHSKWQIWDFFTSFDSVFRDSGVAIYTSFDPLVTKMLKERMSKKIHFRTFWGHEITRDWLENELTGLSLFGASEPIFIYDADTLNSEVKEFILTLNDKELQTLLVLTLDNGSSWSKALQKANTFAIHTIESPRFWEINKLVDFLANWFNLKIAYNAKTEILQIVDHDILAFYQAMTILSVNFADLPEINRNHVLEVLEKERLDTFDLALLFCKKQYVPFADKLLALKMDQEKFLKFFSFMQGHLLKLKDPSVIQKKDRLTQYDKDILNVRKSWNDQDLDFWIQRFSQFEILTKKKDSSLDYELQKFYFIKA